MIKTLLCSVLLYGSDKDYEKRKYKKTAEAFEMWKGGENQLDWINHKLRSTDNDWRLKSPDRYNKKETKEIDRTQA